MTNRTVGLVDRTFDVADSAVTVYGEEEALRSLDADRVQEIEPFGLEEELAAVSRRVFEDASDAGFVHGVPPWDAGGRDDLLGAASE